jgi:hypothetical protein
MGSLFVFYPFADASIHLLYCFPGSVLARLKVTGQVVHPDSIHRRPVVYVGVRAGSWMLHVRALNDDRRINERRALSSHVRPARARHAAVVLSSFRPTRVTTSAASRPISVFKILDIIRTLLG